MEERERSGALITKTFCISSVENTLRKIENIKSLLHVNRIEVSKRAFALCNDMYLSYLDQLEGAFDMKVLTLNRLATGLKGILTKLKDTAEPKSLGSCGDDDLHAYMKETLRRCMVNLQPFLSLQMVADSECPSLSYIKCSDVTPKDVYLELDRRVDGSHDSNVTVHVYTDYSWDLLLGHFLKVLVHGPLGEKVDHQWEDSRDGNYRIKFCAAMPGVHVVVTKLYGHHVCRSPLHLSVKMESVIDRAEGCHDAPCKAEENDSVAPCEGGFADPRKNNKKKNAVPRMCMPIYSDFSDQGTGEPVNDMFPDSPADYLGLERHISNAFVDGAVINGGQDSHNYRGNGNYLFHNSGGNLHASENEKRDVNPPFGMGLRNADKNQSYCNDRLERLKSSPSCHDTVPASNAHSRKATPVSGPDNVNVEGLRQRSCWRAYLLKKIGCTGETMFHHPTGLCVSRYSDIFVADMLNHRICILDPEGREKHTFGRKGYGPGEFVRPSAMVMFTNGTFAVKDDVRIQLFSSTGQYITALGKGVLRKPYGLAVDECENVVTFCAAHPASVFVFPSQGGPHRMFPFEPLAQNPVNSKCRFLDLYNRELFVSDLGLGTVYKTDLEGHELLRFGKYGQGPGKFMEPSGIQVDVEGNVLVADGKTNRVQVFDIDGRFRDVVAFSHPIHRPSGILLSGDSRLLVLNYNQETLAVYKLDTN